MTTTRDLARYMLEKSRENARQQIEWALASVAQDTRNELTKAQKGQITTPSYLQHVPRLAEWMGKHTAYDEAVQLLTAEFEWQAMSTATQKHDLPILIISKADSIACVGGITVARWYVDHWESFPGGHPVNPVGWCALPPKKEG